MENWDEACELQPADSTTQEIDLDQSCNQSCNFNQNNVDQQEEEEQHKESWEPHVDWCNTKQIDCVADRTAKPGAQTSSGEDRTSRTLFVGNIGYRETWKKVKEFFSKFGNVSHVHIIYDHIKKRSKGIGFVEFESLEGSSKCLEADNNEMLLNGRILRVNCSSHQRPKRTNSFLDKNCRELYESLVATKTADQEGEGGGCYTDMLLDEMWKKIFSYLSVREIIRLERVCRRFRDLALQLWQAKTSFISAGVFRFLSPMTDKILKSLLARCGSLRSLDISTSSTLLSDGALDLIGQHCPQLTKLNMSRLRASNKAMQRFSPKVPHLKVIVLQGCSHVSEKGLWYLFHNCKQLEHFDIAGNLSITGKCFHMVGPNLRTAVFNDCIRLTDYGVQELCRLCPRIEELQMQSCVLLSDDGISAIASGMTNLRVLYAGGRFPKVTETVWQQLGNLHNLEELRMDVNDLLTNIALKAIIEGCPKLRFAEIIVGYCFLKLDHQLGSSDRQVLATPLHRNLNISGSRHHIDDTSTQYLGDLQHLTTLDIGYHDKITDQTLNKLAVRGQLEKLVIRSCTGITDAGVLFALEHLQRLTYLDLSGNLQVSARGLALLPECDRPRVELYVGGSSIVVPDNRVPSWLDIREENLSRSLLHPCEVVWLPEMDEEEAERSDSAEGQGFGDDNDYDADDPLSMEQWNLS